MAESRFIENTINFPSFIKKDASVPNLKKRIFPYRFALVLHDILLSTTVFYLFSGIADHGFFSNTFVCFAFFAFALIPISYFQTNRLYSFHTTFSKKHHLENLSKSFAWGMVSIALLIFFFLQIGLLSSHLTGFAAVLFFIFLLASKYWKHQFFNLVKSIGTAFFFMGLFQAFHSKAYLLFQLNWALLALGGILSVALIAVGRFFLVHFIIGTVFRRHFRRQLLIVGSDSEASSIATHIIGQNAPYWISGVVGSCGLEAAVPKKCLGSLNELPHIMETTQIDELIVTDEKIEKKWLISILDY